MKILGIATLPLVILAVIGCGGGNANSPLNGNPLPQQEFAPASISIHDMPPAGVTVLSFQATITGIAMQPGNVSMLNTPMTLEMTQLQGMSAYMGTVLVPVGNYTSMTITLANPQMTFLNDTGSTMSMGGMMDGTSCANGQICQLTPAMMAYSVTISGSPFPLDVAANTPFNLQMDFDLMDSMQSNMGMNPDMTSMMQQSTGSSDVFDHMDDMVGQISSVDVPDNQFTIGFVQGMPSMTVATDTNTTFEDFDAVGKTNDMAGLAQGEIVLVKMRLMAGGTLRASEVRLESVDSQVLLGMVVAMNSATQFDMVVMNEAPAFQGVNIGDVVRMNLQSGAAFNIDDTDLPVSGMPFGSSADMMVGQMVEIEPTSALVSGTPPQLNTNTVRLMETWMTATVASKIDASTFSIQGLPGMFGAANISTMTVSASSQTEFDNVSGVTALNLGDTVSIRGPLFIMSGTPTIVASKVLKH